MHAGRIGAAFGLVLACLFALSPASASAKPPWEKQERSLRLALELPASRGYELVLLTEGHRQVTLNLRKGEVWVGYQTAGRVSRRGIEADFGALGKISLRFEGRRLERYFGRKPPPGLFSPRECRGRRPQRSVGRFEGSIEFTGERGFTAVDAKGAWGEVRRTYRRVCEPREDGLFGLALSSFADRIRAQRPTGRRSLFDSIRINTVTAGGRGDGRHVFLLASEIETDRRLSKLERVLKPFALTGSRERREGVLIERIAFVEGKRSAFAVSPRKAAPATATVAFPKPLEGKGSLIQASGQAPSWSGTLVAHLPGLGSVPLNGPGISAILCRTPLLSLLRTPCERRAVSLVPKNSLAAFFF